MEKLFTMVAILSVVYFGGCGQLPEDNGSLDQPAVEAQDLLDGQSEIDTKDHGVIRSRTCIDGRQCVYRSDTGLVGCFDNGCTSA